MLGDGVGKVATSAFWTIEYYQQFWDVGTQQVKDRIIWSMVPNPKRSYLESFIRPKPDLYGPFWISVTLIFLIAISGNLANYIAVAGSGTYVWQYDFHKVCYAATAVFSYVSLVPLGIWLVLWYNNVRGEVTFLEILCLYGYSMAIYIPISLLWVIQVSWFQWLLVLAGSLSSGFVLLLSLLPAIRKGGERTILPVSVAVIALHMILAVGFVMYFFSGAPAAGAVAAARPDNAGPTPIDVRQGRSIDPLDKEALSEVVDQSIPQIGKKSVQAKGSKQETGSKSSAESKDVGDIQSAKEQPQVNSVGEKKREVTKQDVKAT
ncbi:unnamed protein product [Cyprideis torosa]|uniref:Protein YIPF n=1 Tax=Cyprideis torosa TaxID=163714 RepID=A0A7R8ZM10_9CRUS|nr:unnamed protein product [Cyprideis torosa]CAG0884824.1 unnamed protein product [Cyprideis torosa]